MNKCKECGVQFEGQGWQTFCKRCYAQKKQGQQDQSRSVESVANKYVAPQQSGEQKRQTYIIRQTALKSAIELLVGFRGEMGLECNPEDMSAAGVNQEVIIGTVKSMAEELEKWVLR